MRGKLLFLTIIFVIFLAVIAVRFFILDHTHQQGIIKVISSPPSTVFLDNKPMGKTPFEGDVLSGEHELKLVPTGEATQAASFSHRIVVVKNTLTYLNIELGHSDVTTAGDILGISTNMEKTNEKGTGEVMVETDPQGGVVALDNEEKGTAPLVLTSVAKGTHEVSVSLPTFFPRTQKIQVVPGYRVTVFFKLALDKDKQKKMQELQQKLQVEESEVKNEQTKIIVINQTPTGWLRVRGEASIASPEVTKVNPGQEFEVLEEKDGWYKIAYEKGKEGWVSSEFVTVKNAITPTPEAENRPATGSAG